MAVSIGDDYADAENLTDRQAADAVRSRIDWKYALGSELTDPGFHFSVLCEFRSRLIAGEAEQMLLEAIGSASPLTCSIQTNT